MIALLRYIHLNPVMAGMTATADEYPWSSHRAYLGTDSYPWLTTDVGLGLFGRTVAQARAAYSKWMAQAVYASEEQLLQETHPDDPRVLGGDRFLAGLPPATFTPRSSETLEELADRICEKHGVSVELVRSPSRHRALTAVRVEIASQAVERRVATIKEVALYCGRDPSGLSALLQRYKTEL